MDATKPSVRQRTLLFVDDEEDILLSIETLLETCLPGARVRTANSGHVALDLLRAEPVDLIVSDFKMPGMDGIAFLKAARELAPDAQRLLVSAFTDPALEARARSEAGALRLVPKPIDVESFLRLIEQLLAPGVTRPLAD